MDRQTVYPGQIPLETDLLNTNKNTMIGLAKLAHALLGDGPWLTPSLTCVPTSPASLQVDLNPGQIYSMQNVDGTAYSSLAADTTHTILKQGILMDALALSCPAPTSSGQSINYLIQVAYQDYDGNSVALPYYNPSNPAQAYSGPNNSGTPQATVRQGKLIASAKAGTSATTGTQTTPAPDAGYIGAWVVTVAYGQTTITSGNISQYAAAPFLPSNGLVTGGLQESLCTTAVAGGTADAITAAFTPAITTLTNMKLRVRAAYANATATPTFTPNSGTIAAANIVKGAGTALVPGDIAGAGHWLDLEYDVTLGKWVLMNPATGLSQISIQAAIKNLNAYATGLDKYAYATADEVVLENGSNGYVTRRNIFATIDTTITGANGLDTGAVAANSWYSLWAIYNPTTNTDAAVAVLAPTLTGNTTSGFAVVTSLSSTASMRAGMPIRSANFPAGTVIKSVDSASQVTMSKPATATTTGVNIEFVYDPVMPSGYTHKARFGWIRTDGTANKFPLSFQQTGKAWRYVVKAGGNVAGLPAMASGIVGNNGTPTWVGVSLVSFVPPTAARFDGILNGAGANPFAAMVAPNNSYGALGSATNPPVFADNVASGTAATPKSFCFEIESSNIYWSSSQATGYLNAYGYEDNL